MLLSLSSNFQAAYLHIDRIISPGFTKILTGITAQFFDRALTPRSTDSDVWADLCSAYLIMSALFVGPDPDQKKALIQASALRSRKGVMPWIACSGAHFGSACEPGGRLQACPRVSSGPSGVQSSLPLLADP